MGYTKHDAVIATGMKGSVDAAIETFRIAMPDEYRHLLVGPIATAINGDRTWFFAPDGSKEWWRVSDEVEALRERFMALFDGSDNDVVTVTFGGDYAVECEPHAEAMNP